MDRRMTENGHLRATLVLIALFLGLGLVLEALAAFRVAAWMNDAQLRSFVVLGHAHGGVLGLLNLGLSYALSRLGIESGRAGIIRLAAWLGAALVGCGFIVGGLTHGPTDPGPAILVVPAGALMLLGALVSTATSTSGRSRGCSSDAATPE